MKIAIIAGEPSGDLLGGDLLKALAQKQSAQLELVGVGGDAMEAQGLVSLFDYHDLSIIGVSAIVAQLPKLLGHIRRTVRSIVQFKPDVLVIIDSPAFTHRVAKQVRAQLPNMPVVNYVCPTVWAWKPERALAMTHYVDHVLAIFPFEEKIVRELKGPPVTYVGHRLANDPALIQAYESQCARATARTKPVHGHEDNPAMCLVLPGSRKGELKRLLSDFTKTAHALAERKPGTTFHIPTLPRLEQDIVAAVSDWTVPVTITTGLEDKWRAFGQADVALAASGTVLLELALCGLPCVSAYKLDPLAKLIMKRVTTWTVALPNFIADYPTINEYINESVRPGLIARRLERLMTDSNERIQMLADFDRVRNLMQTDRPPADIAAETVLDLCRGQWSH